MTTKGLPPSIHGKLPVLFWMGNISSVFIFYGREIVLIKTAELTGAALDWAVARCEGAWVRDGIDDDCPEYSTYWNQGGPIIEREGIALLQRPEGEWLACAKTREFGPTLLIAAMRCYVASKLGDEVDVPEELVL